MKKKEKEYDVALDVFFMVRHVVWATSKKEAIEIAMKKTNYGEGEELTAFEVNEVKND